jgi:2-amino-4-hydroxy-6-hydroxymethyldihydropteridine diphosphokinase
VPWVALSLGSNEQPQQNISTCLDELLLRFNDLELSAVFASAALNQPGVQYLNMAVGFTTDLSLADLVALLKKLEDKHKRVRGVPAAPVSLDIDVLLYGDKKAKHNQLQVPHKDLTSAAYMLWPLSQIAGKKKHPDLGQSYRDLWQAFAKDTQAIKPVAFEWHGRQLTQLS